MANIRFNSAKVGQIAGKIDTDITKLNDNLAKLDAILEEVRAAWSGAAATSYYKKAVEKRNGITKVANVLGTLPDNLRNIARVMESAEGDLANR